ncbi:hypothetical protein HHK36_002400 [Tetracentron sinense]|uniref:HMA domain-containing protein n=1 Tax=Tetracentron sinense TaxID=13715 RepID=A0A834ZWC3_TETSI|nr:hypothetical protein HHK36_002400 [Tetracentron sinense]
MGTLKLELKTPRFLVFLFRFSLKKQSKAKKIDSPNSRGKPQDPLLWLFHLTVELKVEMVGIHEKRLRKCLSKIKGIEKVEVDVSSQKVAVTGYAHRNKILKALRRAGLKAEFWSAQNELLNAYASASTYGSLRINNFNFF